MLESGERASSASHVLAASPLMWGRTQSFNCSTHRRTKCPVFFPRTSRLYGAFLSLMSCLSKCVIQSQKLFRPDLCDPNA